MTDGAAFTNGEAAVVDELPWLHAHEYVPWGAHVAAAQEHRPLGRSPVASFGLAGAKAALVNDHIAVVIGGRDHPVDHVAYTCRVDLFDTRNCQWLKGFDDKGDLPRRVGHSVVSIGGRRAVLFGGEAMEADRHCLNDCYEITFVQNVMHCTESPTTPEICPHQRAWHSACAVTLGSSDAMLVFGGRDESGKFFGDIWALVMEETIGTKRVEFKWVPLTPSGNGPLPLAYHSAVSIEDGTKVVVIGGRQSARAAMSDAIHMLDITANSWTQVTLPTSNPVGWTARCGLTALEVCVPLDESTGRLARILASSSRTQKEDPSEDSSGISGPTGARRIIIFGGFTQRAPVSDPTRFALLDKDTGQIREIHAPSVGLSAYIGQAALVTADGKSLYVFGGIEAQSRQFVEAANAIHFWKPQPGGDDDDGGHDNNTNAIRTKVYDNGDVYTGEMDPQGATRHGQGRCVYHGDNGSYDGEWRDDMRAGQGMMTYANGDTYAGQWKDDRRHGFGILEIQLTNSEFKARTETRYDGQWEHDRRAGKGTARFSDGSKLEGEWHEGELTGEKCRLENYDDGNGVCTYVGEVLDGLPHGHGESKHTRETYVGQWLHGRRSGHGVSTLLDGTAYTGDWKNGKCNGFGKCVYARTRDQYDGKWVGGVRCGRGICQYANGAQYDGEWRDDKCHGLGTYTFADGTFYQGHWKENKFGGDGTLVLDLDTPPALE